MRQDEVLIATWITAGVRKLGREDSGMPVAGRCAPFSHWYWETDGIGRIAIPGSQRSAA